LKEGIANMTQTTGRFFDELGKLITDAAGAAQGVRKEVEGAVRTQAERVLRELDVVQREEFEAVKAMAQKAREENERLKDRIAELEAVVIDLAIEETEGEGMPQTPRPIRRRKVKRSY
jgi:BMFP domain-containing protein YqiC